MGWANCGQDSRGRPVGYAYEAVCDHPECDAKIDRGLSYACGGMHGSEDQWGGPACEGYFCSAHRVTVGRNGRYVDLCAACAKGVVDTCPRCGGTGLEPSATGAAVCDECGGQGATREST